MPRTVAVDAAAVRPFVGPRLKPLLDSPGWARALSLVLALGALFLPGRAAAQDAPIVRPERLYMGPGPVVGSTRVVALGGAYTGIAEGGQGFTSNLASMAHRAPGLDGYWDVGLTASWLDLTLTPQRSRDLDNDGEPDQTLSSGELLLGLFGQYRHLGFGLYSRLLSEKHCGPAACVEAQSVELRRTITTFAGAVALGDDDFIFAFGIYAAQATLRHQRTDWDYDNAGVEFDMLYRPHRRPFRFGVSVKPEVNAPFKEKDGRASLPGGVLYESVVSPGVLSVGASFRLGKGSEHYNRLSPVARREYITRFGIHSAPAPFSPDAPAGRWLLSAQVDLIGGVTQAVPVDVGMRGLPVKEDGTPARVGEESRLAVRFGVEHDTLVHRLRSRLGTYLEPSAYSDRAPRLHGTAGFELRMFELLWQQWSVSASVDVAPRFTNLGLAIGFWQ